VNFVIAPILVPGREFVAIACSITDHQDNCLPVIFLMMLKVGMIVPLKISWLFTSKEEHGGN